MWQPETREGQSREWPGRRSEESRWHEETEEWQCKGAQRTEASNSSTKSLFFTFSGLNMNAVNWISTHIRVNADWWFHSWVFVPSTGGVISLTGLTSIYLTHLVFYSSYREKIEDQLEKEARFRQLMAHSSHDSAIDTDSMEWETEVVEFEKHRVRTTST